MNDNVKEAKIISTEDDRELVDALQNLVAELGSDRDKRAYSTFQNTKRLSMDGMQDELNAMYRTDWLCGKVVDIIPNDMCREWRSFIGDCDPEIIEQLVKEENRLELRSKFNLAHKWARLYGTAFIIMSIDDGNAPDKPLDMKKIKPGGLKYLNVIDRHRLNHADVVPVADPLDKNFGMPIHYRFNETSVKIHHSRVIRFDGVQLPFDEFKRNNYYSDSVLDRLYEAITNLNIVSGSAASMVFETNVDVISVKGLMNYLQTTEGTTMVQKRFALAKMLKSMNNLTLIDAEETWDTKTNTFAGLPDLLDRYAQIVTAGSDVPATRLLGSSASGLNATGEGDLKNYYDKIKADQISIYKPRLDYFDEIMARSLGLDDKLELTYEFNPLFQMTPEQISLIEYQNAQRDQIYINAGVISEVTVAKELKETGVYSNITDEDIEELEGDDNDFTANTNNLENELESENEEREEEESESSEGGEIT